MVLLCPRNLEFPGDHPGNVCETPGLHGGGRIPQFQVSRTEKDWGIVGMTIYYEFEEC